MSAAIKTEIPAETIKFRESDSVQLFSEGPSNQRKSEPEFLISFAAFLWEMQMIIQRKNQHILEFAGRLI